MTAMKLYSGNSMLLLAKPWVSVSLSPFAFVTGYSDGLLSPKHRTVCWVKARLPNTNLQWISLNLNYQPHYQQRYFGLLLWNMKRILQSTIHYQWPDDTWKLILQPKNVRKLRLPTWKRKIFQPQRLEQSSLVTSASYSEYEQYQTAKLF